MQSIQCIFLKKRLLCYFYFEKVHLSDIIEKPFFRKIIIKNQKIDEIYLEKFRFFQKQTLSFLFD